MRLAAFICLVWMARWASHGAWLLWDFNTEPVTGYRVHVGTNSRDYVFKKDVGNVNVWLIPRLSIPLGKTNYFAVTAYNSAGESDLSAEAFTNWASVAVSPITNVTLPVPAGKWRVDVAASPSAWLAQSVVTGPTNMVFPTSGTMGFFRFKPYFLSFTTPKGGATKLMTATKPINRRKPIPISPVASPTPISGRVNIDPSKR